MHVKVITSPGQSTPPVMLDVRVLVLRSIKSKRFCSNYNDTSMPSFSSCNLHYTSHIISRCKIMTYLCWIACADEL